MEALAYDSPKLDAAGAPVKDAQGNAVTEKATTPTQTLPQGPAAQPRHLITETAVGYRLVV